MLQPIATSGELLAQSKSSADFEQAKADTINELTGALEGDDCPLCKNRGYIANVDNGAIRLCRCSCMAKREALREIKRSGLTDILERCTLESYSTPNAWQRQAKTLAEKFIASPDGWFVATGGVGSGKTHLCTAICGKLLNAGVPTRYMQWRTDAPRLKALVNDREDYERMINPYKRTRCLYIDDFYKGTVTDADVKLAFELLNERYNSIRLITIISSEKSISEIMKVDEAIGSRIYERGKNYLLEIAKGNNWRLA